MNQVWVGSGSVSDQLKFEFGGTSGEAHSDRFGYGSGQSRFWLWVLVNVGSGKNQIGLYSKHVTSAQLII